MQYMATLAHMSTMSTTESVSLGAGFQKGEISGKRAGKIAAKISACGHSG
jgi:hypothetical protein